VWEAVRKGKNRIDDIPKGASVDSRGCKAHLAPECCEDIQKVGDVL